MANEQRLIDAKDFDLRVAQKSMMEVFPNWKELPKEVQDAVCKHAQHLHMLLETQPTIDAAPVVHGRWARCGGDLHSSGYAIFCSACNKVHFVHYKYSLGGLTCKELFEEPKYCPSCGAVMESEE